jgi:hypothetical protein
MYKQKEENLDTHRHHITNSYVILVRNVQIVLQIRVQISLLIPSLL